MDSLVSAAVDGLQSCLQDANPAVRDEALTSLLDILALNAQHNKQLLDSALAGDLCGTLCAKLMSVKSSDVGGDVSACISLLTEVR
jgi:hypothetical protein